MEQFGVKLPGKVAEALTRAAGTLRSTTRGMPAQAARPATARKSG